MSAEAEPSAAAVDEQQITFTVKAANDQKFVLTLPGATTVADLKTNLSASDKADIPTERIRLIYSGRVLKDPDTLASAKLKDGHTIHMVKGAASNARQNPANASTSTPQNPAGNVPTNIAAGTGNNPLAAMTGARYAGFHGLPSASQFGADGGMGPPPVTDDMIRMMDDPNFLQQMYEMMDSPVFQQMMESNPMLQNNPMARQLLRDPAMRRMMFSPQMMRMQLEMQRAMGDSGGGAGAFPAPGVTDTTVQTQGAQQQQDATAGTTIPAATNNTSTSTTAQPSQASPFANLLGNAQAGGNQANPFAALFGNLPAGPAATQSPGTADQTGGANAAQTPQANPFAQLMAAMGGAAPQMGGNPQGNQPPPMSNEMLARMMGAMGGGGQPFAQAAPPDNRPPEERYADQLRQLNDMGFYEFERNVQALRQSGGSVQGAVEYLLSHP